jgi:hypothetical protein
MLKVVHKNLMILLRDPPSIILLAILILAFSVRLLGINYGLPYVLYPDEAMIVNHAVAFGTGDLNPHAFVYPSLYMYVLFIVYGTTYVTGRFVGVFGSINDFIHLFFTDVTIFYLPGRLIAVFCGVAAVWMVYKLGRRAYTLRVGLISAAILSFSVLHVFYSHFVKTHVPAGLLVIIALWFAWSIYQGQNKWWRYCAAGATVGLGASTIYHAGLALVSIGIAHLLHSNKRSGLHPADLKLGAAALSSFAAFVLTTPYSVLDWSTFFSDVTASAALAYSGEHWMHGTFYPFTSLIPGFGQPLGTIALLGLGYALVRHRPADLILGSQPLTVGLFFMLFPVKEPHHTLIAYPAISILAGSFVADAITWLLARRIGLQPVAAATVTALLVTGSALQSFESAYRFSLPDTRLLAKLWVEEHIPPGSRIVMDSGKYYLGVFGPPLRLSHWTLEQFIARGESLAGQSLASRDGTRRAGYSREAVFFSYQLQTLDNQPAYDVTQILHDVGSPRSDVLSLEDYRASGMEYAITSSWARDSYFNNDNSAKQHPNKTAKYRNFYQSLEVHATLLRQFSPSANAAGPTLRIYKLR